jgi:Mitochondrial ribosomal protein (VAR1)
MNIIKKLQYFKFYNTKLNKNTAKKIIKRTKLKIIQFLGIARKNRSILINISNKNNLKNNKFNNYKKLCNYIDKFYMNFAKKCFMQIKIFIYYKQLMYINKTKYNYTYLKYLKNYLEILYKKNVEFNLVNIKRFYLNSDILSESITLKLTKNRRRIVKTLKNLRKKVKIRIKKLTLNKPSEHNKLKINMTKKIYLNKLVTSSLKYKHVTGFRLEARGRLTRRYTASRSVTKFKYKGNLLNTDSSYKGLSSVLLKGNLRSNVQYTKLKSKTRIGSFGIKG